MDFIMGMPRGRGASDMVWVVVDRLTKSIHLIPIRVMWLKDIGEYMCDRL